MNEKRRFGKYLRGTLIVGDFVVLNIAYLLALWITDGADLQSKWVWLIANLAFVPSVLHYSEQHNYRIFFADKVVLTAFKSAALQIASMMALLYIFDIFNVGLWDWLSFGVSFFLLLAVWWVVSRRILKRVRRMGFNFKRTIIVGAGRTGMEVAKELNSDIGYGYRLMGVFDTPEGMSHKTFTYGSTHLGAIDDVGEFVRDNKIDIIYYTQDAEDEELVRRLMLIAEEAGADFVYVPAFSRLMTGQFMLSSVGNLPAMKHSLSPLNSRANRVVKRVLDLAVSVPFLIVSPIIFIPIAIGIRLSSPGPVFFRQKRTGIHGTEFICYKFRTMRVNDLSDKLQATSDDPRKTRFGDFLRRSSLDELPQFFNVLIGNMSVVGPRPHMVSHTEEYSRLIEKYMVRHSVKPGITGWAQVNGYRGGTKQLWQMEKRVEHDVWYIRNWNFFLDIKIIFLTLFNGLRGEENAY